MASDSLPRKRVPAPRETAREEILLLRAKISQASVPREAARMHLIWTEQAQSGVRHKDKALDKHEQRVAAAVGMSGSPNKAQSKEEKKEKAKKKVMKDANGNELKRPLSAYMLYNNHRRPTLRTEHPGKFFADLTQQLT